jgi:hypothetical protein
MAYTIRYDALTPQAKYEQALEDLRQWLGPSRFAALTIALRKDYDVRPKTFTLMMSFAGVQYYPVEAFAEYLWPTG